MAPREESAEREAEDNRTGIRDMSGPLVWLIERPLVAGNGGEMMGFVASLGSRR